MGTGRAALLANHGVAVAGSDLAEAKSILGEVEFLARGGLDGWVSHRS